MQSLIDELEFNEAVATVPSGQDQFCLFKERQFLEAIRTGSIAMLQDELKQSINDAYVQIGQANQLVGTLANAHHPGMLGEFMQRVFAKINQSRQPIQKGKTELLKFLASDT